MKITGWILNTVLAMVLIISGVAIVSSRNGMQSVHRELRTAEKNYLHLLDEENALQMEWVYRNNLNDVERDAREKLNMRPPRPDQWRVIKP
ncbi:cell division protein FtsL [Magnetococcus sp. PR-3]|uniref:cell division protein FtsL n=1 Tax=Magnetococcus sp. PR-3 TaxID=3120355 RepID=UPI002FCE3729